MHLKAVNRRTETYDDAEGHEDVGQTEDTETDLCLQEEDEGANPADGAVVGTAFLLDEDILDDGRLGDADTVELL